MGFNNSGVKRAQQADQFAQQQALRATQKQEQAIDKYNSDSEYMARNSNIIKLRDSAIGRLEGFQKGKDISNIYPELISAYNTIADQILQTTRFAGKLGTTNSGDASYNNKLQNLAGRNISTDSGRAIAENAGNLQARDTGFVTETEDYLAQDKRAGLGLGQTSVGNWANYKGITGDLRDTELRQKQAGWSNFWSGFSNIASLGTGFLGGFGGINSMFKKSPVASLPPPTMQTFTPVRNQFAGSISGYR